MLFDYSLINLNTTKSKMLKEYSSFKDENKDCILFFQIGDFCETYFNDAKIVSEVTGITLTSRYFKELGHVAMAGVPKGSLNLYIKKLLNNNYKVCFCEQFKDENNICHREAIRTYTRGTIIEEEFLDSSENNYILSLRYDNNKILMSYADVSTGQFYKTIEILPIILLEIEKISPNEILILKEQEQYFKNLIDKYNIVFLDSEYDLSPEEMILLYCKKMQKKYCIKLDDIKEYKPEIYMIMDNITRQNLELTRTKYSLKKKGSLLWFLNYTKTPMGMRLLKKFIDEPLINLVEINNRLDAVEELVNNPHKLDEFEKQLQNFNDLSRMAAKISNSTIYPKELFKIISDSAAVEVVYNLCLSLKSPLLSINNEEKEKVTLFSNKITQALKIDASSEIRVGNIINDGYNANLDYLRSELNKIKNEILNYEKKIQNKIKVQGLKISYLNVVGYYIEAPLSSRNQFSKEYFVKQVLSNKIRYTTDILKQYESDIYELQYKINELEYGLFCELRKMALGFVDSIRNLAKDIALVDVLVSLARCAYENKFSRPKFNKEIIEIKDGYHPSLIKLNNEIIKNDTELKNCSTIILTGANMSGKSTYLKYNAIICLLSQIGSFVPAKSADLTITDRIFVRQAVSDDIINNNSSFMVEMNDLKFILDHATDNSLVMLDEPAKSTNAKEGGAIARAYCEYLLQNNKPKMIISTHNLELTKLEKQYSGSVYNYVIGLNSSAQAYSFDRKIKRGIVDTSLAINTAILAEMPNQIIDKAKEYINNYSC
ncbi:MAG: DNA mismatch repair protein MutS [Candidatus Gastranaerophilales bacterium]|nr:DNA mismatch repair protein MutS [Candidatus Gastranaerophilales bacterium]